MPYTRGDTIAAISTPPGEGAIGIVRLSGWDVCDIAPRVFDRRLRDRRAVYGHILDALERRPIDTGLAVLMHGPRSFTGEDVLEINAHGGIRSLQRVLESVLAAGARVAEPGEFTLRAFLNGRLDLSQAEAVLQLVQARTDAGIDLALNGLDGRLSRSIREARQLALETLAYLGARADFPDEDVPLRDVRPELQQLADCLDELVRGAQFGIAQREGVRVALAGRPNAGKSSLLNRLLRAERAIVTPVPGTTRDTIEETANILGIPVVLTDTAGLRESLDQVEILGVERSHAAIERSAIVVLVIDASRSLDVEDQTLIARHAGAALVIALNKRDLGAAFQRDDPLLLGHPAAAVSALTGGGIDELEQLIRTTALGGSLPSAEGSALTTVRQRDAARRALAHVVAAREGYDSGAPEDLLAVDLGAAVRALGELTGEDATEDLLDTIFSRFCIGK
jgi:tRNA modification GTPase